MRIFLNHTFGKNRTTYHCGPLMNIWAVQLMFKLFMLRFCLKWKWSLHFLLYKRMVKVCLK